MIFRPAKAAVVTVPNCIVIDVPSHERKKAVLGVFPYLRNFHYEYKERF
jgi:hypothetical protein